MNGDTNGFSTSLQDTENLRALYEHWAISVNALTSRNVTIKSRSAVVGVSGQIERVPALIFEFEDGSLILSLSTWAFRKITHGQGITRSRIICKRLLQLTSELQRATLPGGLA
jgi:hypothetical protein